MKPFITAFYLSLLLFSAMNCKQTSESEAITPIEAPPAKNIIPKYIPDDQVLHDAILAMDKKYFDAYNTCDLETQANIYSDDIEFYHDKGGLMTDKKALLQALKDNICGKVTRELIPGSLEVYPIAGYGAVAEGYHKFFNKEEPNAPQKPSKFITVWEDTADGWKISRVISLH